MHSSWLGGTLLHTHFRRNCSQWTNAIWYGWCAKLDQLWVVRSCHSTWDGCEYVVYYHHAYIILSAYANTDSLCSNDLTQHVIGIGTLWETTGVVSQSGRSVYTYLGQNAINVWKNDWQCTSDRPPIESDQGGEGTIGGHWDEACMLNEVHNACCNMFKHAQFLASYIISHHSGYCAVYDRLSFNYEPHLEAHNCNSQRYGLHCWLHSSWSVRWLQHEQWHFGMLCSFRAQTASSAGTSSQ